MSCGLISGLPTINNSPLYISLIFSLRCERATLLAASSSGAPVAFFDIPLPVSNGCKIGCRNPKNPLPTILSKYIPVSTVDSICLSAGAPLSRATVTGYFPSDTAVITVETFVVVS